MTTNNSIETQTINTLRLLSNQMISKAGSGHPGIALGAAPILYELYANQLVINPQNPKMINRDRFVLSAGHGAALLYATLHVAGFNISSDDLQAFRQPYSITPGHPEVGLTPGVEATTGPLGQGLGMAVGMAMAEEHLRANHPEVINHYTYALVGDGDLMEGVSHEAASLAGQQQLERLIVLYDDNNVSLDGPKNRADVTDNIVRFQSYGWQTLLVDDGNDLNAIHDAIEMAKKSDKPSLIAVQTVIGDFGPFAGSNKAHGTPLKSSELLDLAHNLNVDIDNFNVPANLLADMKDRIMRRLNREKQPSLSAMQVYEATTATDKLKVPAINDELKQQAGRKISKHVLQQFAKQLPSLWGGSADLVASTNAEIVGADLFNAQNRAGRNIAFGVREFAMGAVMNGISLHGGTKIFGATFLAFSDYMKAAIRLSALQKVPVIYVFTHDSITVGEDGPTHQPVEQLMALRSIPNVEVLRPGTANEIALAWQQALTSIDKPTILILSRGNLGTQGNEVQASNAQKYGASEIIHNEQAKINLIATGSEVQIAIKVKELLPFPANVISMPNLRKFQSLEKSKRNNIVDEYAAKNVIIEAGTRLGWHEIAQDNGLIFGIDDFGMSAAPDIALRELGFDAHAVSARIIEDVK
ncbi:transketolase family protein [Leuconostoc pseudomesenteroides]|uniref:transketolase family protein n=1 Tax=Leuconostoc pseudomesenteroides TaxID=33968 RepID=UPI0032DF2F8C